MPEKEETKLKALSFKIDGGKKLEGEITVNTSKNSAVSILCASLLNKGRTTLHFVPKIEEVFRIIEVLQSIGVEIEWKGSSLLIKPLKLNVNKINEESAKKTRTIIMMIAPLAHFLKNFSLPNAGGCKLGIRTITPHIMALQKFGVNVSVQETKYEITTENIKPASFALYEMGDTVTENAIMMASLIPEKSEIRFASSNYMVQDLCFFLQKLGVKIEGIGTSTLKIEGLKEINTDIEYTISEDPIEAMSFITAAIVTKSSLLIKRCPIDFLELELLKLSSMNFEYEITNKYKGENGFINLVDIKTHPSDLIAPPEKISTGPYPAINIDNLPFFALIATQAKGQTLIHDWVYENRAIYYSELDKLGADTILADPHRFFVNGKTELKNAEIVTPPALRPAMIILLGMLGAKGESIIHNVYSINRGYEDLATRLNKIGASITIEK